MSSLEKFATDDTPENIGVERLFKFLDKSGFTDVISDSEHFREWISELTFEEFKEHITRINGIMREIPIEKREIDGEGVNIGNKYMGVGFLPPHVEDKNELLQKTFERTKAMNNVEDQGLLLYLSTQYLHLFNDGNGRLGRLLYYLTQKAQESGSIHAEEMRSLLSHDGESGPGRNLFYNEVKDPSSISAIVNQVLVRDVLSEDFVKQKRRPFPNGLMAGSIGIDNDSIPVELKTELETVLSEADGGNYSFRDMTMIKYLENHDLLEEYKVTLDEANMSEEVRERQKTIYRYDAQRLLSDISEEDGQEILAISRDVKRKFVEKLIAIISEPEKYRISEDRTVKDLFYSERRE